MVETLVFHITLNCFVGFRRRRTKVYIVHSTEHSRPCPLRGHGEQLQLLSSSSGQGRPVNTTYKRPKCDNKRSRYAIATKAGFTSGIFFLQRTQFVLKQRAQVQIHFIKPHNIYKSRFMWRLHYLKRKVHKYPPASLKIKSV